jgi:hypothetical protein
MQRLLSILLLMVLGIGPTISAVPANAFAGGLLAGMRAGLSGQPDESQLPACCRRNGKHHCSLSAQAALSGQSRETTVAASDCCPCNPQALDSTAPAFAAILNTVVVSSAAPSKLCSMAALPAAIRSTGQRTQPQRGPPATQIL